jgi:hypothetical protein
MPASASSTSGKSFAIVATPFNRLPSATPRALTMAQKASATASVTPCMNRLLSAGISTPTLDAKIVETAAAAKVPSIHSSTPDTNPA